MVSLAVLVPRLAQAGMLEAIAGWEGDTHNQGYGFATLGLLVPVRSNVVVPIRISASYLYYHFDSTATTITVRSPGASLLTGVRAAGPRWSIAALVGAESRWDHRTSDAIGSQSRDETVLGFVGQIEGDVMLRSRLQGQFLGSYGGAVEYLYGRGAIRYQVNNLHWRGPISWFGGLEAVRQGNADSDGHQAGGFIEASLVPQRLSLGLHAGYKESWSPGQDRATGGYIGLGLYRRL